MINITLDDAISTLEELVFERGGDYVYNPWYLHQGETETKPYPRCTYVKDGEGDCGVGAALIKLGVSADQLVGFDHAKASYGAHDVLESLENQGIITYEPQVSVFFSEFQTYQDVGMNWDGSLCEAKAEVGREDH